MIQDYSSPVHDYRGGAGLNYDDRDTLSRVRGESDGWEAVNSRAFLSCVLNGEWSDDVSQAHLRTQADKTILELAADIKAQGGPVTPQRLIKLADMLGKLDDIGGSRYIETISRESCIAGIDFYAEKIVDAHNREKLRQSTEAFLRRLDDPTTRLDELSSEFIEAVGTVQASKASEFSPISAADLIQEHPERGKELIHGIVREGETWNTIAAAKVGKSWFSYYLMLCIANGLWWLGKFRCEQGRVLLIDNELHPQELAYRIRQVAHHMDGASIENLDVISLRGRLLNIEQIGAKIISRIQSGYYKAIILDAKYRAEVGEENSNDAQKDFFNLVDKYAGMTKAAWILVHHTSKGDQSGKSITDIGAGGGSQSRATDVHMVLRDHEEEDCAVLDAAMRSHKPMEPLVLRFCWPLWQPQEHLDPRDLKKPQGRAEAAQDKKDRETIEDIQRILSEATEPLSVSALQKRSVFGRDRVLRGINLLANADELDATMHEHANGKSYPVYSLIQGSTAEAF